MMLACGMCQWKDNKAKQEGNKIESTLKDPLQAGFKTLKNNLFHLIQYVFSKLFSLIRRFKCLSLD